MKDSNRIKYFWLGLGVGVTTAALFAPKSGAETRKLFQTRAQDAASRLKRQAEDLRDHAVKTTEQRKLQVKNQLNRFSRAMDAGRRALKEAS